MHVYAEEEEEVIIKDSHRKEMNMKMIFFCERHAKAMKGKMIENIAIYTQSERKGIQLYYDIINASVWIRLCS